MTGLDEPRMGYVFMCIEYPVNLDNENMVSHARESIFEDVIDAVKRNQINACIVHSLPL